MWWLRRYLPGTILSRCRTRLSVGVQFTSIEAASRERGIDWVCKGVKKCTETFRNTGKIAQNPCKAVRCVCTSVLKRTVCKFEEKVSAYRNMHQGTVPAERERYLLNENNTCSNLELAVMFPFLFEIPPEHIIWDIVCAHVTLKMCTMLSEHVAKLHISLHTPAWIVPYRLCT